MIDSQKSFKVVSLFSYQGSLSCLSDSFISISLRKCSVKNFFDFFLEISVSLFRATYK